MKKRIAKSSTITNLQPAQLRAAIGGATATPKKEEFIKVELVTILVSDFGS